MSKHRCQAPWSSRKRALSCGVSEFASACHCGAAASLHHLSKGHGWWLRCKAKPPAGTWSQAASTLHPTNVPAVVTSKRRRLAPWSSRKLAPSVGGSWRPRCNAKHLQVPGRRRQALSTTQRASQRQTQTRALSPPPPRVVEQRRGLVGVGRCRSGRWSTGSESRMRSVDAPEELHTQALGHCRTRAHVEH